MTRRMTLAIAAASLLLFAGILLLAVPLRDCAPCQGRRHPVWDMSPEARAEILEQVKLCRECRGKGRVPLLR